MFDISVGGNIDKVKINLRKKGYREKHIYGDYVFTKGKVVITLIPDIENEIIEYIEVSLKSTNWFHKGYYK